MMRAAIAAFGVAVLTVLLLVPFHPEAALVGVAYHLAPPSLEPYVWGIVEWGGNVVSFAILAAIVCIALRPRHAFLVAALVSASCEFAQMVIPDRQPSISDFALNTVGAAVGTCAVAFALAAHRAVARRPHTAAH